MSEALVVRAARAEDADAVAAIYAPVVRDTVISFESEPPSPDEMRARMLRHADRLPWLVGEREGEVVGYAYAAPYRERDAYRWSVEVSVYVDSRRHRSGVGRKLYEELFARLRELGYRNTYAGITLPNPASVGLHESLGFRPVGVYEKVGYKNGGWHDVGWWQRALAEHGENPSPPRPVE